MLIFGPRKMSAVPPIRRMAKLAITAFVAGPISFSALAQIGEIGTIADLIKYRSANESLVTRVSERTVKTAFGEFVLVAYQDRAARQPQRA